MDSLDSKDELYGTRMALLLATIRPKKIKTSLDLVSETGDRFQKVVTPSLPCCDYLIINETVIIHAPEAGCAMRKDGSFLILGSLALPDGFIKGSVGAGDTFCAASLTTILFSA